MRVVRVARVVSVEITLRVVRVMRQHTAHSMEQTACSMQHAADSTQHTADSTQHTGDSRQQTAPDSRQETADTMLVAAPSVVESVICGANQYVFIQSDGQKMVEEKERQERVEGCMRGGGKRAGCSSPALIEKERNEANAWDNLETSAGE
jgi:hypothetical protein